MFRGLYLGLQVNVTLILARKDRRVSEFCFLAKTAKMSLWHLDRIINPTNDMPYDNSFAFLFICRTMFLGNRC